METYFEIRSFPTSPLPVDFAHCCAKYFGTYDKKHILKLCQEVLKRPANNILLNVICKCWSHAVIFKTT